ncbi:hypothetical protein E5676_scaffold264G00220 [Cucumis melo var. makuwa]|uniref:Uncharacterized protein n=1 Tax=Cucumis melo var. makuwa TaxID=1194695 RepID=A0A5D3BPQ9_CUCMM|nr:hypothetical protein E5676_scaffold264G00220 [Cucumis melo var. makuwa]
MTAPCAAANRVSLPSPTVRGVESSRQGEPSTRGRSVSRIAPRQPSRVKQSRTVQPLAQPRRRTSSATHRSRRSQAAIAPSHRPANPVDPPESGNLRRALFTRKPDPIASMPRPRCLESTLFLLLELVEQISRVVPVWVSFGITTYLGLRSPTRHQSSMDIDMIRVIRRDPRSPIVLVSSGFTTDQYVLGAPSGHRRPDFRSYGSACCTCSGTYRLLGRGRGKGKGQAGERPEVTVCDIGRENDDYVLEKTNKLTYRGGYRKIKLETGRT